MLRGLLGGYARGRRQTSSATLSLNFLAGINDSRITYSGGANGTRVNSSGVIVAATTPRFDYDPVTLAARGLLVEEARTNLMLRSQEMATAPWFNAGLTSIANNTNEVLAPDGLNTATKVVATGAGSALGQAATLTATAYSGSIYLRCATGTMAMDLLVYLGAAPFTIIGIASIVVTTTWQRFSVVTSAATAVAYNLQLNNISAGTLYTWGAQLEAGSFPTSYIPTTSASVTRTADSAVMTGTNFSSWYNQSEGTFVAGFSASGVNGLSSICEASDGTYNERLLAYVTTVPTANFAVVDGGVTAVNINAGAYSMNSIRKLAAAYALNDFAASLNGGAAVTDASGTLPTVNALYIGGQGGGGGYLNGHIQFINYYPRRMADGQLQTLTA